VRSENHEASRCEILSPFSCQLLRQIDPNISHSTLFPKSSSFNVRNQFHVHYNKQVQCKVPNFNFLYTFGLNLSRYMVVCFCLQVNQDRSDPWPLCRYIEVQYMNIMLTLHGYRSKKSTAERLQYFHCNSDRNLNQILLTQFHKIILPLACHLSFAFPNRPNFNEEIFRMDVIKIIHKT
jgi:hypothetical protein